MLLLGNYDGKAVSTAGGGASVHAENVVVEGDYDGSATSTSGSVNVHAGNINASGSISCSAIQTGSSDDIARILDMTSPYRQ